MDKVRMGIIGYGCRSYGMTDILLGFDDVEVTAVCDKYEDRRDNAQKRVQEKRGNVPFATLDYKELLASGLCDAVLIATDWELHIPIAIDAMEAGVGVALEVGGAYSVEDCWKLVDTWERTRVPFMFLENCCYNRDELLATAIARRGDFGRIVHASGSYSHDLRKEVTGGKENRHYRLRNYLNRNCENYPTHELGPMAKLLNINRGNRMLYMVSIASDSFGMEQYVEDRRATINPELIGVDFKQGDVVHTIIKCANGESMMLKLDTSLPRSYNREFTVRGTKGMYEQVSNSVYFDGQPEYWSSVEYFEKYKNSAEKYKSMLPDAWKDITKEQLDAGHGGMDYVELREFIDRLKSGEEMLIDVYDAASWMVITALSESSIAEGGKPMQIPDFTRGKWLEREPVDVLRFNEYVEE
ncbi:MAG: Gfo/Idh/MocA family oxidoreductase [Clostridia bacterium]|nr:Gfo/Idh/MocA family oxidoreductase [Clostridia bacterium]